MASDSALLVKSLKLFGVAALSATVTLVVVIGLGRMLLPASTTPTSEAYPHTPLTTVLANDTTAELRTVEPVAYAAGPAPRPIEK